MTPHERDQLNEVQTQLEELQDKYDDLKSDFDDVTAQLAQAEKDKERLDWVELQTNGLVWIARQSETGRGFRLHNERPQHSPMPFGYTAREAIDRAMAVQSTPGPVSHSLESKAGPG